MVNDTVPSFCRARKHVGYCWVGSRTVPTTHTLPPTDSPCSGQKNARLSMSLLLQVCEIRDEGRKLNQYHCPASGWISRVKTSNSSLSEDVTEAPGFDLPSNNSFPLNLPGRPRDYHILGGADRAFVLHAFAVTDT